MEAMANKNIKEIINKKREELNHLILSGVVKNSANKDVILKTSEELDKLIYEYYKNQRHKDML